MLDKVKRGLKCFIPNEIKQHFKYRHLRIKHVVINEHVDIQSSRVDEHARLAAYSQIINSTVGAHSSIGRNSKINNTDMGKFCSVSWNVTVGATNHYYELATTHAFPYKAHIGFAPEDTLIEQKVIIGHDVWIGCNCVVMPGVKIGHGAVIGAGAVVTRDIPDYAVVCGVPGRVIRDRFDKAIIARLLELQWWDFPAPAIKENVALFQRELTEEALERLEQVKDSLLLKKTGEGCMDETLLH